MTHIGGCDIFIAISDENRRKPKYGKGLSAFTTPIDFSALL